MASNESAPAAKRLCTISREQLIKRCSLEGISVRSNLRIETLLNTANAHGLLALAPEPQVQCPAANQLHAISKLHENADRMFSQLRCAFADKHPGPAAGAHRGEHACILRLLPTGAGLMQTSHRVTSFRSSGTGP